VNTVPLTALQTYYLEALGRHGRIRFLNEEWAAVEYRLASCWYASGLAEGIDWIHVRDMVKVQWDLSPAADFALPVFREPALAASNVR